MAVRVGSARINELGKINGGKPGDQTGNEVGIQNWYLHSKGWVVIRPKTEPIAEKIAKNMESICNNNNIGYCQDHRSTLTLEAKQYGYDASKVKKKVEVDCSEAVRNCLLYAGINVGSFSTMYQVSTLKATNKFDILYEEKYCKSSDYLKRGDILVTKTKGHTVVVLDNGKEISANANKNNKKNPPNPAIVPPNLKRGSKGIQVKRLQKDLNYILGSGLVIDGEFGVKTDTALKQYQKKFKLTVDGIYGKNSMKKMKELLK